MNKSPYINDIDILFCHEARKTLTVKLDFGDAEKLPAGTLVSVEGKVVNDTTVLGVLLHDEYKYYGSDVAEVLVAGHVDLEKAQEHAGVTYSAEAKAMLKNIVFVGDTEAPGGGGGASDCDWNIMKNKPFGEIISDKSVLSGGVITANRTYALLESGQRITDFETLIVVFDGVRYPVDLKYTETENWEMGTHTYYYFGNTSLFPGDYASAVLPEGGAEYPFLFITDGLDISYINVYFADDNSHTFDLVTEKTETVQIDPKYIPPLVLEQEMTGNYYTIGVDFEGNVVAIPIE